MITMPERCFVLGPDAEGAVGEDNTKVQFRSEKTDQVHHTRFHRHASEQLGQGDDDNDNNCYCFRRQIRF